MLNKCEEGTRYIHRKQFASVPVGVPNNFSVAYARRDECGSHDSHPGGETRMNIYM